MRQKDVIATGLRSIRVGFIFIATLFLESSFGNEDFYSESAAAAAAAGLQTAGRC